MKKEGILFIVFIILSIFSITLVRVQGIGESGLPPELEGVEKLRNVSETLTDEELRKEYLKQEWTKLLADKKAVGPILFYTHKFFSFFNPFWKAVLGVEFFWSWMFIFSFMIWILLIILMYYPIKNIIETNPITASIASICISSLVGLAGTINKAADLLATIITNKWFSWALFMIIILMIVLYTKTMKDLEKKSEEEKLEEAKKSIKSMGEVAKKELESYSKK